MTMWTKSWLRSVSSLTTALFLGFTLSASLAHAAEGQYTNVDIEGVSTRVRWFTMPQTKDLVLRLKAFEKLRKDHECPLCPSSEQYSLLGEELKLHKDLMVELKAKISTKDEIIANREEATSKATKSFTDAQTRIAELEDAEGDVKYWVGGGVLAGILATVGAILLTNKLAEVTK